MRKVLIAAGAVALGAGSFFAGRLTEPAPALAQAAREHGGKLERPHDVTVWLSEPEQSLTADLVTKWEIEKVGESSFLRLTSESGALHYFSLDKTAAIKVAPAAAEPK